MAMNLEAVLRIAAKVVGLDEVSKLERGIAGAEKAASSAQNAFKAVASSATWQAAATAAAGLGVALGVSAKAAIDFESAMADVKKVVPGLDSAEGLKSMKDEILNLSRELPVSAEGLADIMAAAGQAGIAKDELSRFTEQAAKMGVAFDISAAEAGNAMAKLRTNMGLSQKEVENLADAINHLSNNMASSAPEITDFMKRSGAVGKQVAMSAEQTAAFGSAMIAAGAAPEVASTSFNNLIKAMSKGETATASQSQAFKRLGLDVTEVAKNMQVDAVGTIRDVFQRIAAMPAEMRVSTISQIFGDEARALTPLITNMKLFDQAMGLVGDKSQYAGSMLAEFNTRAGTSANNWQLLQNNLKALQIVIGDALLPAINLVIQVLTPVIQLVSSLAGKFPVLTAAVIAVTSAIAVLVVAAPAIVSFMTLWGSLQAALAGSGLAATIAGWAGAIGPAIVAIKGALLGLVSWLSSTLLPGLLAFFSGPVGWTVLAVAAVVAAAIAFREPLMNFVSWLWDLGEPIRNFWIDLWGKVKDLTTAGFSGIANIANNLFIKPLTNVWESIKSASRPALESIVSVVEWFGDTAWALFDTLWLQPVLTAWDSIGDAVVNAWEWIGDASSDALKSLMKLVDDLLVKPWQKLWNDVLQKPLADFWAETKKMWGAIADWWGDNVVKPISDLWSKAMDAVESAMAATGDAIKRTWEGVINGIKGIASGFLNAWINAINGVIRGVNNLISAFNALPGSDISFIPQLSPVAFAEGGIVNRPTLAMVGEGGEREYIVPESKMAAASSRFLSGSRGADVIPTSSSPTPTAGPAPTINVTTGPVLEFDGRRYVTVEDYHRGLRQVADGVFARLRTPASRRALGVT